MTLKTSPFQIEIPRRAACCAQGGEPFQKGCEYYSTLVEGADEGQYERRDYCLKCAVEMLKENAFENVRSLWKSAIPPQKVPSDLPKQREAQALVLLKEALSNHGADAYAEAFVLALYLARRRRIFLRQEITLQDGKNGLIYEVAETEEMLCIPKIALSDLQVEKIQSELAKKFSNK